MCPTVRDTRTIEWTVAVTDAKRAVKETQEDSRVVFITEGLPQEMKPDNYGRTTAVPPGCPDHVMDLPQARQPQQVAVGTSRHLPDRSTNPRCSDKRAVGLDGKGANDGPRTNVALGCDHGRAVCDPARPAIGVT
jgi:hypothetical protein